MKILVVGSGAREHALCWALSRSPSVREVHAAPGNPGIAAVARLHPVGAEDIDALVTLARRERFDLVVVGPERPLSLGLADALAAAGIAVFGCSRAASEIESSKGFAKSLMERAGVPTAEWRSFEEATAAIGFGKELLARDGRVVVKADGLAAGKGVEIVEGEAALAQAVTHMLALGQGAAVSPTVLIEQFLAGREASCMALCDGERVYPLPACEDHKTLLDGDRGPMTGGMGAVCPTPIVDAQMLARIEREILKPTAHALVIEGRPFHGLLYAGLMLTDTGPKVLEFNCRFGDPEAESLLARTKGDLAQALLAIARGGVPQIEWWPVASCTVVLAAAGYPGSPEKGAEITGLVEAAREGAQVFHAGTRRDEQGRLRVDGGRVLAVTATGADADSARARAYRAASQIHFEGMQLRLDIGARAVPAAAAPPPPPPRRFIPPTLRTTLPAAPPPFPPPEEPPEERVVEMVADDDDDA